MYEGASASLATKEDAVGYPRMETLKLFSFSSLVAFVLPGCIVGLAAS